MVYAQQYGDSFNRTEIKGFSCILQLLWLNSPCKHHQHCGFTNCWNHYNTFRIDDRPNHIIYNANCKYGGTTWSINIDHKQ
ncbi:hypothetical protein AAFF_G00376010 [Aldrovandia affinis]|uniref:Uncharacterized protein n=1 Tax=Aldrovandia affinis TaxID=143900 RepID=A0AAD7VYU7_9TELE|nr:hypothetical protein AAFF_G00376010 [Aldrovandia affinis]